VLSLLAGFYTSDPMNIYAIKFDVQLKVNSGTEDGDLSRYDVSTWSQRTFYGF